MQPARYHHVGLAFNVGFGVSLGVVRGNAGVTINITGMIVHTVHWKM